MREETCARLIVTCVAAFAFAILIIFSSLQDMDENTACFVLVCMCYSLIVSLYAIFVMEPENSI